MSKVIIFGIGQMAEMAKFYLEVDSEHEVVAFCVKNDEIPDSKKFDGINVIPFEKVQEIFPAEEYFFFAPMSSENMNTKRQEVYNAIKNKGYKFISYISSNAVVYNSEIGDNCFIQAGNVLHPFTKIGNNVVLWSGNLVGHHSEIKDHVTFASHVALAANCIVGENSYLGTNSTIRDGIILAKGTLVGIATAITKNTEEWSVYMGNPSRRIGKNISKSILKI